MNAPKNITDQLQRYPAMLLPGLHKVLRDSFPQALWQGNPTRREIALTFDDGPHAVDTPAVLDVLTRHQIPATFFHIGQQFEALPLLAQEIIAAGHQIGLHGYRHQHFPLVNNSILRHELDHFRVQVAAMYNCPLEDIRDVRPPYGTFTAPMLKTLVDWGYRVVMWSLVPNHRAQSIEETLEQVAEQVKPGTLLVLHEGWGGPDLGPIAEGIIARLKDDGYSFVTVNDMWPHRTAQ